jgi:aryl-alcohol dehydrogenase-like predicted oxidoreductase
MNYRIFGKSGLRVSELCLGTMTFGSEWGWGADYEESKRIFDVYAEAGGNFIDTANRYTEGSSEKMLGEFVASDRHHFVLATKYSLFDRIGDPNFSGNHRKNMLRSVEASLKRLQTDFIDVLYVHAWDSMTPVEEVLMALNQLVMSGKVLYLAISDTPAWVISRANTIAELRGWNAFIGLQAEYSLLQRTAERDLIPMAKEMGLALTPWAPLAGGALSGKYLKGESGRVNEQSARRNDRNTQIVQKVVDWAEKLKVSPAALALKWTMQKDFVSIPVVGARKAAQLQDSIEALSLQIPEEVIGELDTVSKIDLGFPHEFLASKEVKQVVFGGTFDAIKH